MSQPVLGIEGVSPAVPHAAYRQLAAAVLTVACSDAKRGDWSAQVFLCGGAMLPFWCAVAGIPIHRVMAVSRARWPRVLAA
jgi:hypothetical protein